MIAIPAAAGAQKVHILLPDVAPWAYRFYYIQNEHCQLRLKARQRYMERYSLLYKTATLVLPYLPADLKYTVWPVAPLRPSLVLSILPPFPLPNQPHVTHRSLLQLIIYVHQHLKVYVKEKHNTQNPTDTPNKKTTKKKPKKTENPRAIYKQQYRQSTCQL